MKNECGTFDELTPDIVIGAVEKALDEEMSALASPLPSYINRVYELQTADGRRVIGKFYRPGRWSIEALEQEHDFVLDCADEDIPVVAPLQLHATSAGSHSTIGIIDDLYFAVYPKRSGRELNLDDDESWLRLGSIVARMHLAGDERKANERVRLHPSTSTEKDVAELLDGGFITSDHATVFQEVTTEILNEITPMFNDVEYTRVHGDCHRGNILERPEEGILVIDFDDMMTGPPMQDLWLLLPGHMTQCRNEIDLLLEGYERFRDFDDSTTRLIEPLRAMRMIYFLAWCARQSRDFKFQSDFPDWGSNVFWRTEIDDLRSQLVVIKETNSTINRQNTPTTMDRVLTDH
ncbi:MAG: serine/threonine protein kinase [Kiritimatiellaeota bacterium]|nr:serine/threonine protein kinase [Kiritimatiellota bacterium]